MNRRTSERPATLDPVALLRATAPFRELTERLVRHEGAAGELAWGGFWGSARALCTAALSAELGRPLLVVCADAAEAESAAEDLRAFGRGAFPFPAREGKLGTESEVLRARHRAMARLARPDFTGCLVAPLAALAQPVPRPGEGVVELVEGGRLDPDDLARRLVAAGYERVPAIAEPGEFARRGDVLDVFPPALGEPLRLEFFDDELESLRVFDLGTQRTRHVLRRLEVPLVRELPAWAAEDQPLLPEVLPDDVLVVLWDPDTLDARGAALRAHAPGATRALTRAAAALEGRRRLSLATLPGRDGTLSTLSVEEYAQGVVAGLERLAQRAADGEHVLLFASTRAEAQRMEELLAESGRTEAGVVVHEGVLERGFRVPEARLTVLHHGELLPEGGHGRRARRAGGAARRRDTAALHDAMALRPGDLVVHAVHGLCRFRGMEAGRDGEQDVLVLEFADGVLLKVPASRVDLVERYVGAGGTTPKLDKPGTGAFLARRRKVEEAVEDLAASLLEVQARRAALPGFAFPDPGEDQRAFEASFPWEDTPDQVQGTREIHEDLGRPRAMDRLVCGDVGYGKTELAARAAFRAIHAGKQVAVLVPTTVLCEQHLRSFRERFADWPVTVAGLSRLVRGAERRQVLEGLASGAVDLVVGTHRLLSSDVKFRDLGLVVVDEEQRFGVEHKERLKRKRAQVDVLTLTATPVPRTLHMALAGLRDITSLATAPAGRREIHTEIRFADEDELVREAIRRELDRGGQAFFLHNRVRSLPKVRDRLQRLVPEARLVLAHGQMEPRELEKAMLAFVRGDADVLVSTTIVESGLDIPNANTILVDDAHRHGLADLHQLRGRVGRSTRRGYCYLLVPRGQPLPNDARRRLKAIEEMRYLGAGFQLALRDLEIRGAGNLLGPEQSGHIQAVGYETYRRLLAQAVARLRNRHAAAAGGAPPVCDVQLGVAAALPSAYVPEEELRLEVLRELDGVRTPERLAEALEGLRDRFGPPPDELTALARLFFLKHRLGALGFAAVHRVGDHLACTLDDARAVEKALTGRGVELRIVTARRAHWMLPRGDESPAEALEHVFGVAAACRPRRRRGQSRGRAGRRPPRST